ncbi:bifunctional Ribosomal protein L15 [Babesia duncani]|uniref:Bifunctional Ribosomal protein L15 n=1 Tax=Babesia duncani TaxID=323732 RepID=A0AAD9PIY8_9APIC|nr:bifunctional Ribosomal protein L15 [Babesia duncani]
MFSTLFERHILRNIFPLYRTDNVITKQVLLFRNGIAHSTRIPECAPRKDVIVDDEGNLRGVHYAKMFGPGSHDDTGRFNPHPFNRRFAFSKRPLFPIEPRNLRIYGLQRRKQLGRGKKSSKGYRFKGKKKRGSKPNSRTFEGGQTPLYKRLPKWPEAWLSRKSKKLDPLNLSKLRYFIERGRLDTRFPITQRHLYDSKCVRVKRGVQLFNVNDYPFPYKIDIEVAGSDQSSIDAIKNVGGTVTIVYYDRVNLRAHLKPYKFEVLPKTARPSLDMVHYLEKMRARGCNVVYIKPMWLIKEEKKIVQEMQEVESEILNEDIGNESAQQREERLVKLYRERLLKYGKPYV